MTLLAIETSTKVLSFAKWEASKLGDFKAIDRRVTPTLGVNHLIEEFQISHSDSISEIIVDVGPGIQASSRAGISFALGYSWGRPAKILRLSSLTLMQFVANSSDIERPVVVRRGPNGSVFARGGEEGQSWGELMSSDKLAERAKEERLSMVGLSEDADWLMSIGLMVDDVIGSLTARDIRAFYESGRMVSQTQDDAPWLHGLKVDA